MITIQKRIKPLNGLITVKLPNGLSDGEVDVLICSVAGSKYDHQKKDTKRGLADMLGSWRDKMVMSPDFDEPLDDFKEYM